MTTTLRLMCVLAHPDDESLGAGGALASCAAQGIETYLVTATRGERGRYGDPAESPGLDAVGRAREAELHAAARELGLREVQFLGYRDGELDQVAPAAAIERIVGHLRRVRPHVVVTFGPDGLYGHPDHIAISQLTVAAVTCAADPAFGDATRLGAPHRVAKLYFIAWSGAKWAAYQAALRRLVSAVDGVERQAVPWPDWAITTVVDTSHVWPTVWRAVSCHKTQMAIFKGLATLSDDHQRALWGTQEFYRVFSVVNGGRAMESDLFEGLR
ncbi:1D-myo-inositol 2-acetamido-2-deoxy-alpha-D-glucopyranoside deacetylase [Luteitalea pratensis]|uniref:1D-myo-inositol 2-acetamido-2-deoxy-alpha-D-glucopyranoside deacetylase n=1 Tax=Luteitalea pratensis TaxID=1855912 RepID=A0A143PSP2_LUTPR|nr:PIG-L family deacetylase [Luteitalea pratensis]AMY10859.1 1D-myo-inositol 2-acetamido-2-deoxy-alpha-D-glucopyranoside deacetylase [Luteitalea pratensis]